MTPILNLPLPLSAATPLLMMLNVLNYYTDQSDIAGNNDSVNDILTLTGSASLSSDYRNAL